MGPGRRVPFQSWMHPPNPNIVNHQKFENYSSMNTTNQVYNGNKRPKFDVLAIVSPFPNPFFVQID